MVHNLFAFLIIRVKGFEGCECHPQFWDRCERGFQYLIRWWKSTSLTQVVMWREKTWWGGEVSSITKSSEEGRGRVQGKDKECMRKVRGWRKRRSLLQGEERRPTPWGCSKSMNGDVQFCSGYHFGNIVISNFVKIKYNNKSGCCCWRHQVELFLLLCRNNKTTQKQRNVPHPYHC